MNGLTAVTLDELRQAMRTAPLSPETKAIQVAYNLQLQEIRSARKAKELLARKQKLAEQRAKEAAARVARRMRPKKEDKRPSREEMKAARHALILRDSTVTNGIRKAYCMWCGVEIWGKNLTVEHIKPLSEGGLHEMQNMGLACRRCNNRRTKTRPAPQGWCFRAASNQSTP